MTNDAKLQNTMTKKSAPKKRKIASLDKRKSRIGWYFVLPFLIGFVLIYLPVIFDSVKLSFFKINILQGGGFSLTPVGFENYQYALFEDPDFVQVLLGGMKELAFDIPAIIIFSLFMAVLLNQKMIGRAVFRAIFFVPVIISTGLMEAVNAAGTTADAGGIDDGTGAASGADQFISMMDVQMLFSNMKVGTGLVTYVIDLVNSIYDIVNFSGVQMLIFLAGLQSISPAIYEASRIDGASAWETFWKVTFPMVSPMIFVNAIYTIIDSFTRQSNVVMKTIQEIYDNTSENVATAQAWTYFLVVILIVAVFAAFASAFVFYQKRDS